jgi:hypothetical protein
MNPRVTVGLLAILVALAAYYFFGSPPAGPAAGSGSPGGPEGLGGPGAATPKPADPSLDLWAESESDVQSVSVKRGGQETGVKRAGDDWQLTPSGEPADRLRVNSLIFRLASVKATYRVPNVSDESQFGLAPPAMVATIGLTGGGSHTLAVGAKAPAESGTYVRKDADPAVYLVSNALAQDLERIVTEPPRPASPTPLPSPAAAVTPSPSP